MTGQADVVSKGIHVENIYKISYFKELSRPSSSLNIMRQMHA